MRREILLLLLAGLSGSDTAVAQEFGWPFGQAFTRPAPRIRHVRPAPVDVPLPVPRPSTVDPEPAADAALTKESDRNTPPAGDPPHAGGAGAQTPPLPPQRPASLESAPASAAPVASDARDGGTKPTGKEPPVAPARPAATAGEPPPAASATSPGPMPPLPPEKPADVGSGKASPPPAVAPSGATTAFDPREPAADAGCADRLKARGVTTEPAVPGPQPDARCTIVQPVRLLAATLADGSNVSFPDSPTIACTTADAFSAYVRDLLAPLAKGTWGVGLASVWTGPGFECRSRDHIFGAKLSAHGQGLAVDVAQMKLGDGRVVAIGEPRSDAERGFETAARAGGCGYFHTALGPGSDSYHRTHWHFDLEVRGREGDSKYCK